MSEIAVAYTLPDMPDPNGLVIDLILGLELHASLNSDARVSTDLPDTGLVGSLPFALVNHWGGDIDRFGGQFDVDVSFFAATYALARDLARTFESRALGYPFRVSTGGRSVLVDKVVVPSPTVQVPWAEDSPIRRFQGTYQFSIRR